jgi:pyruvate kinase
MSATRIVCTIGPATNNESALRELTAAGMNVARLNGAHGDLDWHAAAIALLHEVMPEVPVLLDIPGRKIRTADLAHEPEFASGNTVVLTTGEGHDGSEKVPVNRPSMHKEVNKGDVILADDGTLKFTVEKVTGQDIHLRAEGPGKLGSRKGINMPSFSLAGEGVTQRDRDMVAFAREQGVDYIGISFVDSAGHVNAVRELCGGNWPRIVSKVENQSGLDNLEQIVEATDAVMIDRGDLSVETNLENLVLFQKCILDVSRSHGKPVIVATEMLHTMIENPFPTKAEVSDITNAVLDGCSAAMLSGETAVGAHATESVAVMRRIADAAESDLQARLDDGREAGRRGDRPTSVPQAMEDAVALVCRSLPITKIVAVTISGYAARMTAARRPRQPIIAVSNDAMAARSFNLFWGARGVHVDVLFSKTSTDHVVKCLEELWRRGILDDDDLILVTALGYPRSGNRMNLLQTHAVSDLRESLGWKK